MTGPGVMAVASMSFVRPRAASFLLAGTFVLSGCTTLPSCAWGKCASPRTFPLAPQTSERVYPLPYRETYEAVRRHMEQRGYPLATATDDLIETEPYAEREFARVLGLTYRWRVQIRRMDTWNTAGRKRSLLSTMTK